MEFQMFNPDPLESYTVEFCDLLVQFDRREMRKVYSQRV